MYTKLEVSNFRAFSSIHVAPLNRLNLIAGDNNIGKTGILEALYFLHADFDGLKSLPSLFRRPQPKISGQSRDVVDNFWLWLFHKHDLTQPWTLSVEGESAKQRLFRGELQIGELGRERPFKEGMNPSLAELHVSMTGEQRNTAEAWYKLAQGFNPYRGGPLESPYLVSAISTRFQAPSEDAELFNAIAVRNEDEELVECLRLVEPRLSKLKYLRLPDHEFPYVYADIGFGRGRNLIPATQLGQGFARLLTLFATIMVSKTRILLIDEFENGLQHDALTPIWKALDQLARGRDIQVFATTHSYECIRAAHDAASEATDYDLGVIRLQWNRSKEVEAVVLDREMIETALDARLEVR